MSSCVSPKARRYAAGPLSPTHSSPQAYNFSPPSSKVSSPRRVTQEVTTPPSNPALKESFITDYEQHCRRILDPFSPFVTYSDFEELLHSLHLISCVPPHSDQSKVLLIRLWRLVKDQDTGQASKELLRSALMEIVGVERMGLNVDLQKEFRRFAVCRLKHLHTQEYASEKNSDILVQQDVNSDSKQTHYPLYSPSKDKENISKTLSPLRIPETKCPFVTIKVNITPVKFDVINIYEGDNLEVLAQKFALKHELGVNGLRKLLGLMEKKLGELRRNKAR